ncbi:MAG: DNA (cytosine-5-)-methyltransferase [Methylococcales bacterium]|nr:DNA (cytosine-5-)-methyltransferase [Methylococcales bacterium]
MQKQVNYSALIKEKRLRMGLCQKNFAQILGLKSNGERTVRGWENNQHKPTKSKWAEIINLHETTPYKFKQSSKEKFTFIDLFAGIGGIRLPFQALKGRCVFTSEWDKFAQKTYAANYGEVPHGDITEIPTSEIPEHDILLGGFPCQAFSQAGLKKGFSDTRGTMFFEIQRILTSKRPKAFLLENVKQLQSHNKGKTFETITAILRGESNIELDENLILSDETLAALSHKLNYWVSYKVLRAADYGLPQNRQRIYIVGFNKDYYSKVDFDTLFTWPKESKEVTKVGDILLKDKDINEKYTISEKLWRGHQRRKQAHKIKGNGFGYSLFNAESEYTNTISARYYKDGSEILIDQSHLEKRPRKLTPRECANLQGFPQDFIIDAVSDGQIYKQFGNSVAMPVIRKVATEIIRIMDIANKLI